MSHEKSYKFQVVLQWLILSERHRNMRRKFHSSLFATHSEFPSLPLGLHVSISTKFGTQFVFSSPNRQAVALCQAALEMCLCRDTRQRE